MLITLEAEEVESFVGNAVVVPAKVMVPDLNNVSVHRQVAVCWALWASSGRLSSVLEGRIMVEISPGRHIQFGTAR